MGIWEHLTLEEVILMGTALGTFGDSSSKPFRGADRGRLHRKRSRSRSRAGGEQEEKAEQEQKQEIAGGVDKKDRRSSSPSVVSTTTSPSLVPLFLQFLHCPLGSAPSNLHFEYSIYQYITYQDIPVYWLYIEYIVVSSTTTQVPAYLAVLNHSKTRDYKAGSERSITIWDQGGISQHY